MNAVHYRSFSNGYNSYSRSFRATQAESEGKKPLTRAARHTGIPANIIRDLFEPAEWHHVGKYANIVDYYDCAAILDAAFDDNATLVAICRAMGPRQRKTYLQRVAAYRLAASLQPAGVMLPLSHFQRRDQARARRVDALRARRPDLILNLGRDLSEPAYLAAVAAAESDLAAQALKLAARRESAVLAFNLACDQARALLAAGHDRANIRLTRAGLWATADYDGHRGSILAAGLVRQYIVDWLAENGHRQSIDARDLFVTAVFAAL